MKNTIDYKNLDNVAGGFEITNEEELKRLYEENKKIPTDHNMQPLKDSKMHWL